MAIYNTVTAKLVNEDEDKAAQRAFGTCIFLTPQIERDIDLALGIRITKPNEVVESIAIFNKDEILDIMEVSEPSDEALDEIEAEARE